TYRPPIGEGIRVDDGFREGMDVPIYYDPMLAKLITYADNRAAALEKMKLAIKHYRVAGVETTLSFGRFVCEHPAFISGDFDTHFVKKYFSPEALDNMLAPEAEAAALLGAALYHGEEERVRLAEY
ncbi:MAG: biotin carboxylase, partial [Bacteroidota bacterium]